MYRSQRLSVTVAKQHIWYGGTQVTFQLLSTFRLREKQRRAGANTVPLSMQPQEPHMVGILTPFLAK